jgi:hypothetical protein
VLTIRIAGRHPATIQRRFFRSRKPTRTRLTMQLTSVRLFCLASILSLTLPAYGEPVPDTPSSKTAMDMAQVIELLKKQQKELAEQRAMLQAQARKITSLTEELDALRAPAAASDSLADATVPVATESAPGDSGASASRGTGDEVASAPEPGAGSAPEPESTQEQTLAADQKAVAVAQADDPTQALLSSFPGAWRLPGTDSALRIGGYVRTAIVLNWDVLQIPDRFIVGSIPVDQSYNDENAAQSSITANQSRLNFDYRATTDVGIMRAFIEGDFTGEGNTFELRHAFGQWDRVLAGQTWTAFMDTNATPEGVDFEGLNGQINVRQSQVRFSPRFGENFELQLSLEDPNPEIQNGSGITRIPDIVIAGRFRPHDRLHVKAAILGRQIRGQEAIPGESDVEGGVEKQYAWGYSLSGSFMTPYFDDRDKFLFQLNKGDGIGRYVNDLNSIGNYDGIFNQETGDLQLFNVFAGYGSLQHWWGDTTRSNFTLGWVYINNPGFIPGDAYKRTLRASGNLMWNPTQQVDMGIEYLWGRRTDKDGATGSAQQVQMMLRYTF